MRWLLILLFSLSVAAQPLSFLSEAPVSMPRTGLAGGGTSPFDLYSASNGSEFMVVWGDDRQVIDARPGNFYSIGQAMRFAADGTPLDDVSIALPSFPAGVVWAEREWIVLGGSGLTRISAEGDVLETRSFRHALTGNQSNATGIAWAGDAFVVAVNTSDGLRALTIDRNLNVVRVETVTTGIRSSTPRLKGDGQSALMVWTEDIPAAVEGEVHAASFGRDGLLREQAELPIFNRVTSVAALGTTGSAYTAVGTRAVQNSAMHQAVQIGRDLTARQIFTYALPPDVPWYSPDLHAVPDLVWDGTHLTLYTKMTLTFPYRSQLFATKFTAEGRIAEVLKLVSDWDPLYVTATAAGGSAGDLLAYARIDYDGQSRAASAAARVVRKDGSSSPEVGLERGAFAQETPAAASSATQAIVTWRERTSPDAGFTVYATRLGPNGEVLDPQSIPLGASACREFEPAVASDGRDFLAVWFGEYVVDSARIAADGTITRRRVAHNATGPCGNGHLQLVSNGTGYLAVWQKVEGSQRSWEVYAIRLASDGTLLDDGPFRVMRAETESYRVPLYVASNGQDYLVVSFAKAVRVSAQGAVLDEERPILLPPGYLGAWWNGRTYVVWTADANGAHRMVRIGADGTTPVPPLQVEPTPIHWQIPSWFPFASACDAGGCSIPMVTQGMDKRFGVTILRLEDDGTRITARLQPVVNAAVDPHGDAYPVEAGAVRVPGGPLLVLRQLQRMEQPYSGVHRLFVSPVGPARSRTVRK